MYLKNEKRVLENNGVRKQEDNVTMKSLHYHIHISLKFSLFTCALSNYSGCATVTI